MKLSTKVESCLSSPDHRLDLLHMIPSCPDRSQGLLRPIGRYVYLSIIGASKIFKLNGIIIIALYPAISRVHFPFMAIEAGIAKMVIPSGIPCEKYKTIKVKYLTIGFSQSAGIFCLNILSVIQIIIVVTVVLGLPITGKYVG